MKIINQLKMCEHLFNNQVMKIYWFRGVLPFSVQDLVKFPVLAKFFIEVEKLGGFYAVAHNQRLFDKLSEVHKNIFKLLNEIVLRIGNKPVNLKFLGFESIINKVFKIEFRQVYELLVDTGITGTKYNKIRRRGAINDYAIDNDFYN
jgi:hypothetical protein